jgi:ankyrin repeat protein
MKQLFNAIKKHNLNTVKSIINTDNSLVNAVHKTTDFEKRDALTYAVLHKDLDIIKFLLDKGANVNAKDSNGRTPIHMAFMNDQIPPFDIIKLLIENGADLHVRDNKGNTPFHVACIFLDDVNIINYLIDNGADINTKNNAGDTILHDIRDKNIFKLLIEKGINLNAKNKMGETPLYDLIMYSEHNDDDLEPHGLLDLIKLLIMSGADTTITYGGKTLKEILTEKIGNPKEYYYAELKFFSKVRNILNGNNINTNNNNSIIINSNNNY